MLDVVPTAPAPRLGGRNTGPDQPAVAGASRPAVERVLTATLDVHHWIRRVRAVRVTHTGRCPHVALLARSHAPPIIAF